MGIPRQLGPYNHLGDLDYYDGRLYVPLEGSAPAIGVFDADLNYITHARLPNAIDAPWCAINRVDGHLYTSSFRTSVVRKLRRTWSGTRLALTHVASVTLRDSSGNPLALDRVQGGVFFGEGPPLPGVRRRPAGGRSGASERLRIATCRASSTRTTGRLGRDRAIIGEADSTTAPSICHRALVSLHNGPAACVANLGRRIR